MQAAAWVDSKRSQRSYYLVRSVSDTILFIGVYVFIGTTIRLNKLDSLPVAASFLSKHETEGSQGRT